MLTVSVRGLPRSATEDQLVELFEEHGRVHDFKMSRDIFSGECRGFAEVQMEGHHARDAVDALHGKPFDGSHMRVQVKRGKPNKRYR